MVDCSVGTPCDPPPRAVVEALASSGTERGYPASAGSPALREAAAAWLARRFGLGDGPGLATSVAACVGTKELVASVPHLLRLRQPEQDTVLYPAVSYPTYAMGAELAGCRAVAVPPGPVGSAASTSAPSTRPTRTAPCCCGRTRRRTRPGAWATSAQRRRGGGHTVCRCSPTSATPSSPGTARRTSVLQHGPDGVVAVHSLSKRSNLAGVRVGFYAGDAELVEFLRAVRQHAGLMVPGPAQAAGVAALADDEHVEAQRARYRERLAYLADVLGGLRLPGRPARGRLLPVGAGSRRPLARRLGDGRGPGRRGGLLVSPGDLYGETAAGFVRVAVVQPMERLELVGERLR